MGANTAENLAERLKVFISYARSDGAALAEDLVTGLGLAGFEPLIDRHDIAAAEDWEARLGALIQSADTVVFVISPAAVKSERCEWEVDRATKLGKRGFRSSWSRSESNLCLMLTFQNRCGGSITFSSAKASPTSSRSENWRRRSGRMSNGFASTRG
jgi:hypothetical protein